MVAAAMLTLGLAKVPAKNLQNITAAMLWENPVPRTNRAKTGSTVKYTALLPKLSLSGEAITGPKAIPRLYSEMGRIETVGEI